MERLSALFPPAVSLAVAKPQMGAALWPEEEALLHQAVEKRRREFAAGRAAARAALSKLGVPDITIPAHADRSPQWPAGFTGSITHCDGFCGAVVARTDDIESIGFDAEPASPLPEEVRRIVYGIEEATHFATLGTALDWPKLAFSAKEAFYKCVFPVTRTPLNFRDVRVRFAPEGEFAIEPLSDAAVAFLRRPVRGRWLSQSGLLFTSFVLLPG